MNFRALTATRRQSRKPAETFQPTRPIVSRSGLLFGTALGVSIAILAASPNQAWAADECGADVLGVAVCTSTSGTGNPYPAGIDYVGDAGEDITVILVGGAPVTAVDIVTVTNDGVNVDASAGQNATVLTYAGAYIDTNYDGIDVTAASGDTYVNNEATIYADIRGINADGGGAVTVVNYGDIYTGELGGGAVSGGIVASSLGGDVYIYNAGYISTVTDSPLAAGIYGNSFAGEVTIVGVNDIDMYNETGATVGIWATGQNLGVDISQTGDITVNTNGGGYGVFAYTLTNAEVDMVGDISVESYASAATGVAVVAAGTATINVTGDIYTDVDDYTYNNTGIYGYGYAGLTINVTGDIYTGDGDVATGIDAIGYNGLTVDVTGDIDVIGAATITTGTGISADAYQGDVDVYLEGNLTVGASGAAMGIYAETQSGDILVDVDGDITVDSTTSTAYGVLADSYLDDTTVDVTGNIDVSASQAAYGVYAYADDVASVTVTGNIDVDSVNTQATGVYANSYADDANVTVTGSIDVDGVSAATGIETYGEVDTTITVTGNMYVTASAGNAYGIDAVANSGDANVTVTGSIDVDAALDAYGIYAYGFNNATVDVLGGGTTDVYSSTDDAYGIDVYANAGDATVTVVGNVYAETQSLSSTDNAFGISAYGYGAATVDVTGNVDAYSLGGDATGIYAYAYNGDATVTVVGNVGANAYYDATGVYAYAYNSNVVVDVTGNIDAYSVEGSAYGVYAYAWQGDATVTVVGNIDAESQGGDTSDDAYGVYAYADGNATVDVTGNVDAYSAEGDAYGVFAYALNGDATVTVEGNITADAYGDAYGVYAYSDGGSAFVYVTGDITVDSADGNGYGVYAYGNGGAATVEVTGNIDVDAYNSAYGVYAYADGLASDTNVTVTGNITVSSQDDDAYGVYAGTYDGDVFVTVTGDMDIYGYSSAYGVDIDATGDATLAVTGNTVVNSDDSNAYGFYIDADGLIDVTIEGDTTVASEDADAWGIYADSLDSDIYVDVTGDINVGNSYTGYDATGMELDADEDVVVDMVGDIYVYADNGDGVGILADSATTIIDIEVEGDIDVEGEYYATGIDASALGNVDIAVTGDIDVYADQDQAFGIIATSDADVFVTVTGDIDVDGADFSEGISIVASGGTATVTGNVYTTSTYEDAAGIDIRTYSGDATVDVTGNLDTYSGEGGAWGVFAQSSDDIYVDVEGNIDVDGEDEAFGIHAIANSDIEIYSDGDIDIYSQLGNGYGISADSTVGGIEIDSTGTINVETLGATSAFGVNANAAAGYAEVDVYNVNITVDAVLGAGAGVFAYGATGVNVDSEGLISTVGYDVGGVEAYSTAGNVIVTVNDVTTTGNQSEGVFAESSSGNVYVTSFGDINTTGVSSEGLFAYSDSGIASADNFGGTVTTSGNYAEGVLAYSGSGNAYASTTGDVTTSGDYASAVFAVSFGANAYGFNSATINTSGEYSYGVAASSFLGDAEVANYGDVYTTGNYSHGLFAYAFNGVATVYNGEGHVETSGDYAYGIYGYGYAGVHIENGNDTVITSGYSAVGIFGFSFDAYVYIDSGTVNTTGDASDGIVGVSLGTDLAFDYVTINSDLVTTDGLGSDGIVAYTYNGQITIDSGTITTLGDSSYGIFAYANNDGSIDIESDFIDTSGADSWGIYAYAFLGTSTIDSFDIDTDGANSIGIYNYGFTGAYVESTYVQTDGDFSAGIVNLANYGLATVDSFEVETRGYGSVGIYSSGFDGSFVNSSYVRTYGDRADGIVSISTGGNEANVDSFSVYTAGDYSDGIVALAYGYYDSGTATAYAGNAYVDSAFVNTSGYNAYGITALAGGGDVDVYSYSVQTSGDFSVGIYAAAFNYYDSGNLLNLQGDVYVSSGFVLTDGFGSTGIQAYAEGGNIEIQSFSVVTGGDFSDGINAFAAYYLDPVLLTYYSGDILIEATQVFTYGDFSDGISAYAAGGNVSIFANTVETFGLGSDAIYAGAGGLDANNTDDVYIETTGTIYSFDGRGIAVNAAGGVIVDIDSGSVYGYDWAIQSNSGDGTYIDNDGYIYGGEGRAIDVDGGAAEIANAGVILGFIDLTDNGDYLYNNGLWEAYGTSSFGLGSDEVVNEATVGFSRYQGAASTTTFTGLEFFSNYGTVSGQDNQVNDQLTMTGTAFFGGAGSEFDIDVQLGGPGSLADRLVIGSASGVTSIDPNDLLAGQPGVLNFGGILVVDSANAAEVGTEFVMDNIDKGWVEYELFFDAANDNWLIVGLPDDEVFELLAAMSGAQDFWSRSGDALTARWQELRDASPSGGAAAGPGGMGRSDGWELWMQAHAGDEEFEDVETFDIGGFTFTQDISTDSDWRGFQFGFDNLSGNTIWGLTMGFTQQETNLTATSNSFDLEGWNVGAYAGWASGGFFANGLIKGDFFSVDGNFRTLPAMFEFDGVTWGAKGELGYRWEGEQMFFEPILSLAWTTTDLDDFTSAGATVGFDDAESLVGKAGARIGGTFGSGNVVWTPYIGAYAVEEFQGSNGLDFTSGPTTISFEDTERDGYGQVDFGVTGQTFYGLEGFIKGHWNFGGDADGGGVRMGARWRW